MDMFKNEMEAVHITFEVQSESIKHIPGYKKILGHVIGMDFAQKASYVVGDH